MATMQQLVHPDALELARLLRDDWNAVDERIRASGHPTNEGDDDAGDDDAGTGSSGDESADGDDAADTAGSSTDAADDDQGAGSDGDGTDWKRMARKHERDAKAARKRETDLQARLKKREDADKTEQQKAIDAAREEERSTVTSKYEQERRSERLELAVTRIAVGRGVTIGEGDKAKTVKFADAEDVQMWIERQIKNGDLDPEDLYDKDGRLDKDVLTDALVELANSKPTWLAGSSSTTTGTGGGGRAAGDVDAGKGKGGGAKALEDMTPDEHLKAIQGAK